MSCWARRLRRSACPKLPVCANVCRIVQLVSSPNRWQWQGSADSKSGAARFSRGGAPSLGPGTWAWLRARSSQSAMLLPWARKVPSAGRFGGVKRHGTARGCDPSSLFCQLRLKRTRRLLPTFRASLPRVEATTTVARPDFAFPWPCLAAGLGLLFLQQISASQHHQVVEVTGDGCKSRPYLLRRSEKTRSSAVLVYELQMSCSLS